MFDPKTSRVILLRDIICMYHKRTDVKLTHQSPIVSVPVTMYTVVDTKADGLTSKSSQISKGGMSS